MLLFKDKKERTLRSILFKHALIVVFISIVAWLFLFIMGMFISLHPDAYRDLIRSILIPYALGVLIYSLFKLKKKKNRVSSITSKLSEWWERSTPIEDICVTFTLITLINSIMMLVGIDTPKQGVFAYIHMMTRLVIISLIVILITWKDVWDRLNNSTFKKKLRNFYRDADKHIVLSSSKIFTALTAIYCIVMILFQQLLDPSGGALFYQILLSFLGITTFSLLLVRIFRRRNS